MTTALASSSDRSQHGLHGKLQGKIALITGGNSGIGLATARQFVNEGAAVFVTGRRQPQLAAAVKEIGRNATGFQGDVSNLDDLDRLYELVKQQHGRSTSSSRTPAWESYAPDWRDHRGPTFDPALFDVNVKGLLFTVQKALPLMPNGGSIILNAFDRRDQGFPRVQRLRRDQGRRALLRRPGRPTSRAARSASTRSARAPSTRPATRTSWASATSKSSSSRRRPPASPRSAAPAPPTRSPRRSPSSPPDDASYITGIELFVDGGFAQV